MPEQFMNLPDRERARLLREKYRNEVGPGLMATLFGENVPPSETALNPETGRMEREYIMPSGQPDPATQALRAENDARLQQLPVEPMSGQTGFMGPQDPNSVGPGLIPEMFGESWKDRAPIPTPDPMGPGLIPEMFGESWKDRAPEPAPVEPALQQPGDTPISEPLPGPQADQMLDDQKKRQILSVLEGLTRAGETMSRRMTSPGEIAMGLDRGPVDMTTADMLKQLQERSLAKEAGGPLLDEYNKLNDTNFTTMDQMREHRQGRKTEVGIAGTEEGIEASKAKRAAEVEEQQTATDRAKRFMEGDMSAAPEKIKTKVLSEANTWTKNNEHIAAALSEADKIEAFLEAENSVGARIAITQMVLLGGETGRLTEGDIRRSAERMGFKGYQDFVTNFVISDLNQEQRAEILDIVVRARKHARRSLRKSAKTHVNRLIKFHPSFKQKDLMEMFLGEDLASGKDEEKTFWATIKKAYGDFAVGDPIEVTEEQFNQYSDYIER